MKEFSATTVLKTSWGVFKEEDIVKITKCDNKSVTGRINCIFSSADKMTFDISKQYKSEIITIEFLEIKHIELIEKGEM